MTYPYDTDTFKATWQTWKDYKKQEKGFKYKSEISEQAALMKLSRLSETEEEAKKVIMQSIENGWTGLFKLQNEQTKKGHGHAISPEYLKKLYS